ncbi:LacI family DNA-binding transcriptional regulator [Limobrevibacterium gyesilva]|uniref:Substrate-binding domain-containing protein n=1 Tax=Limobrevibacterium gyesilva TaxID=2991712 RepID=A0AA41YR90_9PROT|nr:substrate-binding domain-containing protein [Limobrevibacterium gyesilva]MCW3474042.1 substrate-binding domain-containing protein [Limobrevibacterium gyesilva]
MRRVTIKDVAKAAGVSLGTASRVINANTSVDPAIRRKVQDAIAALRYQPDAVAQSMRRRSTRTIGAIVRDITVPALASFVQAAQQALHDEGYALLIACSGDRRDHELELLRLLSQRRMDGVIMTTAAEDDAELAAVRAALPMPVVMLDRTPPGAFDALLLDHREGMRQAVEHLLRLGHRRIALITGATGVHPARARVQGFRDAHAAAGVAIDPTCLRTGSFTDQSGFLEASALLGRPDPPTAIVAGGIDMLSGVLRAIQARGFAVPRDISVIGSADTDLAMLASPPVTVVRWDYAELGRAGARLLIDRLSGGAALPPRQILFPTEFISRGSCAPPSRQHC